MLRLRKPSPAMVVACISLFIGLSGAGTAAVVVLKKNSVLSKHIRDGQVKTADLGANAVNSAKVGDGSLLAQDFAAGQLPAGPQGPVGQAGPQGPVGPSTGPAGGDLTGNYPNPQIAFGAVTSAEIFDSTIQLADLAFSPATQAQIAALAAEDGTINSDRNPLDWTRLKGVPTGIADGVDQAGALNAYCALARSNPYSFPNAACRARSEAVDSVGQVGSNNSLAIGTDGNPVIAYRASGALRVARCNDPICAGANETLSSLGSNPGSISLAIGMDGNPVFSFEQAPFGNGTLNVVRCNDPACAAGGDTTSPVDPAIGTGLFSSLAIGTDGYPVISYYSFGGLKVARCNDPACAGGDETLSVVDGGQAGFYGSLAIGTDGHPVISYYHMGDTNLKVARCNDPACAGGNETLSTVDSAAGVGEWSSLAVGTDGNPVISYRDSANTRLKVARCNDPACSGGDETLSVVDEADDAGEFSSIAVGIYGNPVISYNTDDTGQLRVAQCNDPACSGANETITVLDGATFVFDSYSSIAIGSDGNPLVSYWDPNPNDLEMGRPPVVG